MLSSDGQGPPQFTSKPRPFLSPGEDLSGVRMILAPSGPNATTVQANILLLQSISTAGNPVSVKISLLNVVPDKLTKCRTCRSPLRADAVERLRLGPVIGMHVYCFPHSTAGLTTIGPAYADGTKSMHALARKTKRQPRPCHRLTGSFFSTIENRK